MNALVTGGAGFIGSHVVDRLLKEGLKVVVLDDFSSGMAGNLPKGIKLYKGDVCDQKKLESIVKNENIDFIFHYAAIVGVERAAKIPINVLDSNINGIKSVLEAARKFDVERIVEASSSEVLGDSEIIKAGSPTALSPYGVSKLVAEKYCRAYYEKHGLKSEVLRYFNVYGPKQNYSLKSWVLPNFIIRCLNGKPPIVYGTGEQTRDFTYISDAVDGTFLVFKKSNGKADVFNLGTGVETSIKDLAYKIITLTNAKLTPIYAKERKFDIKRRRADTSKIKELGFEPKIPLDEGLKKTIEWFKSLNLKDC